MNSEVEMICCGLSRADELSISATRLARAPSAVAAVSSTHSPICEGSASPTASSSASAMSRAVAKRR